MELWRKGIHIILLTAALAAPAKACEQSCHIHEQACWSDSLELLCGYGDFFVHDHGQICYYGNGNIRCELPRISAHTHGTECYETAEQSVRGIRVYQQVLTCPKPQIQLHLHTPECFRDGVRSCGLLQITEHRHGEQCFPDGGESARGSAGSPFILLGLLQAAAAGYCLYLDKKYLKKEKCLPQL